MKLPNGYSLIEMLVVIGIIGILSVGAVASYNRMNDRALVDEAAKSIVAGLLSVQKDAKSGVGTSTCVAGEVFTGMRATWNSGAGTFTIAALCDDGGTITARSTGKAFPDKRIAATIGITKNPVGTEIEFQSVTGGANQLTITISGSTTKIITITTAGGISVN